MHHQQGMSGDPTLRRRPSLSDGLCNRIDLRTVLLSQLLRNDHHTGLGAAPQLVRQLAQGQDSRKEAAQNSEIDLQVSGELLHTSTAEQGQCLMQSQPEHSLSQKFGAEEHTASHNA